MSCTELNPAGTGRAAPRRLAVAVGIVVAAASAAAAPPPIEHFTRPADIAQVRVSPSSTHAAFVARDAKGKQGLAVVDLARPASITLVASYYNVNVTRVAWVNDKRLVYEVYADGPRVSRDEAGTLAVDIDGNRPAEVISWHQDTDTAGTRTRKRVLPYGWHLLAPVGDRSDDVLVYHSASDQFGVSEERYRLGRVDTVTGRLQILSGGLPPSAAGWVLDPKGQLRLALAEHKGRSQLHWRGDGGEWTVIEDHPLHSGQALEPLFIEADGSVIVSAVRGRDTTALYTYDPRTRRLGDEPLVGLKGFDVGTDIDVDHRTHQLSGVHAVADGPISVWFDERLSALQKRIDAALPGRDNKLLCGDCQGARHFVVESTSDRHSGEYLVYDSTKSTLVTLGQARPWLAESAQGRRSFHRVAARDGLPMPVVVTHPPGAEGAAQPLPAVVLVHGGPWVRGATRTWSGDAQFLASRGYRVLEVDFRGSTGLGTRHFEAGLQQWGLAMQDDLVDAIDWAVDQKLVDRARVCIMGASYGGYAALMGPIRHPDRYRCAASFAGVTDLTLMFEDSRSDITAQSRAYRLPTLLGDPVKDAKRLHETSPVNRLAELRVPVLLAQGGFDWRVTEENAARFIAAARAAKVDFEHVDYPEEGHGWYNPANHADFLQRLEKLLARSLKP